MAMETIEHLTEEPFRGGGEPAVTRQSKGRWPLERVLFALAGTMTLGSVLLAFAASTWFLVLTAFVGVNQWLYVVVGACLASVALRRTCHLRSAVYPDRDGSGARRGEVAV